MRPEVRIAEGRMFATGTNEIVVGRAASRQFVGPVGRTVRWGGEPWQVVGIFEANGSVAESELWCDALVHQGVSAGEQYQSVLELESPDFQMLKDTLTSDPRLKVTVMRERDYYARQSQVLQMIIRTSEWGSRR